MKLDVHYLLSFKNSKWVIIAIISLFSLLIIGEYAQLFFTPTIETIAAVKEPLQIPATQQNALDDLLHSSLFGVYIPNDLSSNQIKQSMLNVTLVGVLLGKANESQVIIRLADSEEKNYKVNDTIPGGALIKKIMADGILVEHNGNLERVTFPEDSLTFEPIAKPLRND